MKHVWILISTPTGDDPSPAIFSSRKKLKRLFGIKLNMTKEQDSKQRPRQIFRICHVYLQSKKQGIKWFMMLKGLKFISDRDKGIQEEISTSLKKMPAL